MKCNTHIKSIFTIILTLVITFNLIPNIVYSENVFTDIETSWAKDAILDLHSKGFITGYEDGTFRPDEPMTRAELAHIINDTFSIQLSDYYTKRYLDVFETDWYYDDIFKISSYGFFTTYDSKYFKPKEYVIYEEIEKAVIRLFTKTYFNIDKLNNYLDSPFISDELSFSKDVVKEFLSKCLASTTLDSSISPQKILTRAEIVNILSKIIDVTDGKKVPVFELLFGGYVSVYDNMDMDADYDGDGITNGDEFIYYTDPFNTDSDSDGFDDYIEIFITKTNPRTFDTSEDTIYDGAKVGLGLDPLAKDDPSQKFDFERTADGADFIISGHGNLYYSELKIKNAISGNRSIYSNDYELYIPKNIYSYPIDIKATMKYRESEVDINMLQVYYVSPRTMTFILADSVNIDVGTGYITGIFENLDYDLLMRHSLWFVVGEKGLSEADKYDVVFTFDLSENMKEYDLNNDYSWMEGFINVVEQVNDDTTMGICKYPQVGGTTWSASKIKDEFQEKLEDIKDTYWGQSDIIDQIERSAEVFDNFHSMGTYQNLIIGTVAKFDVDEEEFLNKIAELNNRSIKVLLIVFEDDDTKIEQIKELSNQINGLLIPCRNIGDLKILLGEINKEPAILKTIS